MLLLTLTAAIAAAGCADDTPDLVALDQAEACKAVKEHLDADELKQRFGDPDTTQDFFGDQVLGYEDEREDVRWQFQVSARSGAYRVARVKGSREEIVDCPR